MGLSKRLRRAATIRGVLGGNRLWLVVAVTSWLFRKLKSSGAPKAEYHSVQLKPGEDLIISARSSKKRRSS